MLFKQFNEHSIGSGGKISMPQAVSPNHPAFTMEQINDDLNKGNSTTLNLSLDLVHDAGRGYCKDLESLLTNVSKLLISNIPPEFKSTINADEIEFRLTDSEKISAYVIPTKSGSYSISVSKGLINSFLNNQELVNDNMVIDAIAAVIAHEISHTVFKRKFNASSNSIAQEEFCDQLPAIMLQGSNFNPAAISRICDIFMDTAKTYTSEMNTPLQVHATNPLRKEIYEKVSIESYQKYKKNLGSDELNTFAKTKLNWTKKLSNIVEEANKYKVTSFIDDYLERQGYKSANEIKKAEILIKMYEDYEQVLRNSSCKDLNTDLFNDLQNLVKDIHKNHSPEEYKDLLKPLSKLLYTNWHATENYQYSTFCKILEVPAFGYLEQTQNLAKDFLLADDFNKIAAAALALKSDIDQLVTAGIYLEENSLKSLHSFMPEVAEIIGQQLGSDHIKGIENGKAIPIPFKNHNLLSKTLTDDYNNPVRSALVKCADVSGISLYMNELRVRDSPFFSGSIDSDIHRIKPEDKLSEATHIKNLSAYSIDVENGIKLKFPFRKSHADFALFDKTDTQKPAPPLPKKEELAYVNLKISESQEVLPEIASLNKDNIRDFFVENFDLMIPVFSIQKIIPDNLKEQLRVLPEAFYAKADEIMKAEGKTIKDWPYATFRAPMIYSPFFNANTTTERHIYSKTEESFARNVIELRTDPEHPINKYLAQSPDIDSYNKIIALCHLQGLDHRDLVLKIDKIRPVLVTALGSEEKVLELLGADHNLNPTDFARNLTRVTETRFGSIYGNSEHLETPQVFYSLRNNEIKKYLAGKKSEDFTVAELHEIQDLAKNRFGFDKEIRETINRLAQPYAKKELLKDLSDLELVDRFQRLKALGVMDWNPDTISDFHIELETRIKQTTDPELRLNLVTNLIFPKAYESGERNPIANHIQLHLGQYYDNNIYPSSVYTGKITDQNFEKFLIKEASALYSQNIRTNTQLQYDDSKTAVFNECEKLIEHFNQQNFYGGTRKEILTALADKLLLQKQSAYFIRDNLFGKVNILDKNTLFDLVTNSHNSTQKAAITNMAGTGAHNGIILLRYNSNKELRETLFNYLSNARETVTENKLIEILSREILASKENNNSHAQEFLKLVGINPKNEIPDKETLEQTLKYHIINLHGRFSDSPMVAKAATLSVLAIDNDNPTQKSFNEFTAGTILPRILPKDPALANIVKDFATEYFKVYGDSVHHQFLIACSVLCSEKKNNTASEIKQVAEVIKSFLGAHSAAGYKLLQRIHSHPDTPEEIKTVLADTKYEAVKYTRWEVHQLLDKYHPQAADAWIGKVNSGSICLSIPLIRESGDLMLSLIHPGTHHNSMYWLKNFERISNSLSDSHSIFSMMGPMIAETRRMMVSETDFDIAAKIQQKNAESSYNSILEFKEKKAVVEIEVPEQITSYNIPAESPEEASGCKLVKIAKGSPYLEILDDVKKQFEADGKYSKESLTKIRVLYLTCFSNFVIDTSLLLAGKVKDHDRHGGNLIVNYTEESGFLKVKIGMIDHGCTDLIAPSKQDTQALSNAFYHALDNTNILSVLTGKFGQVFAQNISKTVWQNEHDYLKSATLGVLASLSLNEELSLNGRNTKLLSSRDLVQGIKLAAGRVETSSHIMDIPKGFKPWLMLQIGKLAGNSAVVIKQN